MLARKAKQNSHVTTKDSQEDLADTRAVVRYSTVQHCLHKNDLHGREILPTTTSQMFNSEICKTASTLIRGILE